MKKELTKHLKESDIQKAIIELILENEIVPKEKRLKQLEWQHTVLSNNITESELVDIESIKKSTDLRTLAEQYGVTFSTRQGKNWKAICCFHQDKNPSMFVSQNFYHCFSCGAKGDVITFVQKRENCTFVEALHKLKK